MTIIGRTIFLSTLAMSTVTAQRPLKTTTAFMSPGASPSIIRSTNAVASCYGVCDMSVTRTRTTTTAKKTQTVLHAKKKKGQTGKGGKLQVQMLKHVEGTGRVGDVVMVAPAFFENKLHKSNSAKLVTDEEVRAQRAESATKAQEKLQSAQDTADRIKSLESVSFTKKAGPDGHLFGGIKPKDILGQIVEKLGKSNKITTKALQGKRVKVLNVQDVDGNSLDQDTIKHVGDFRATVLILDDIYADIAISVTSG